MNNPETTEFNTADVTVQLFRENEHKTNKMCAKAMMCLAALTLVFGVLGLSGFFKTQYLWSPGYLLFCSLISFLLVLLAYFVGFENTKTKWIIIGNLIFLSGITYALFPLTTVFLMFGPIFLSVRYYDPDFTARVTGVTWLAYMVTIFVNTGLDHHMELIRGYHLEQGMYVWQDTFYVIMYFVIPRSLVYLFEGVVGYRIASAGRKLVLKRAESSRKAADMEATLDTAARIQKATLAEGDFETPAGEMNVHAYIRPARNVGGDFYDYFMVNDHLLTVAVADVSDKGLPAAMFVIEAQSYLRFALSEALTKDAGGTVEFIDLEKAVNGINRQLTAHNMDGMFVTMWIGCFDTRTGVGKYINAGHNLPYLKRADGSLRCLESDPQVFLGSFENAEYKAGPIRIRHGETLFLYTDGVTDARNGEDETFGTKRLEKVLLEAPVEGDGPEGKYLTGTVCRALNEHIGDKTPYDDITILTLYRGGDSHSSKKILKLDCGEDCAEKVIEEVNSIIVPLGCPDFKRRNLDVAIDEICSNICEYAYEGTKGALEVEMHWEVNYIGVRFTDSGLPFNPLQQEKPDLSGDPQIGGLGIHLVKNLVDRLEYERRNGNNQFTIYIAWNM